MTQAVNLANFANFLDSSGGVSPSALNAATPVSKGGTGATTATAARAALSVPSNSGDTATGNWPINSVGIQTANFLVEEIGGKLIFKYGTNVIASLDSSGNFVAISSVNGGGTP